MPSFEHNRFNVFSAHQHLFRHGLNEFAYSHNALPPGVTDAQAALDYVFNVLYPRNKPAVATPADLPTGLDTPNLGDVTPSANDYRIVNDDGDGKSAAYLFAQFDGDVIAIWHKVADFDWGINNLVQGAFDQTQIYYAHRLGRTDHDDLGVPIAGIFAGQHIFGGDLANQNLTLSANNGDAVGVHTGFIQFNDAVRPTLDNQFDIGTAALRIKDIYSVSGIFTDGVNSLTVASGLITDSSGSISFDNENLSTTGTLASGIATISGTLVLGSGSITDTGGTISFGDENLDTTGTLAAGVSTFDSTLVIATGSITDTSGAISFGDENLTTTGNITGAVGQFDQLNVDNLRLDLNTLSSTLLNGNVDILANGTGVIDLQSPVTSLGQTVTGIMDITGQLNVDNITINAATLTSNTGEILFGDDLKPSADATFDIGATAARPQDIYFSNALRDGTNFILNSELMALRFSVYQDTGKVTPAADGDALFYDLASGTWLASAPDTEIDHGSISGLPDDDHTQYALLAGRSGGQTLLGSTLTTETLTLQANGIDAGAFVLEPAILRASTDNTADLGKAANRFKDLYLAGQAIGLRAENDTVANISAAAAAGTIGRLWYATDDSQLYVDQGGTAVPVGNKGYSSLHTDVQLSAGVNVSADIDDARQCIWQICDVTNNEEIMGLEVTKTATTVTVNDEIALIAGNYRLLGIQIG